MKHKLLAPGQGMTDQPPIDQIAAVVNRNTRDEKEGAGGKVIILTHLADRRVGIDPRDDRVLIQGLKSCQKLRLS